MFGFKKKKNSDTVVDTGKTETCPVKFVRRVDEQRTTKDSGDGEWRYSDTRDTETYDVVTFKDKYYFVNTHAHYYHSYDYGESPMNTESQYTTLCICEIPENMKDAEKDVLVKHMESAERIWDRSDYEHTATEHFVCYCVNLALAKAEENKMLEKLKKSGKCRPNAVYIAYDGTPSMIYIHDFSTNAGLARALDCEEVKIYDCKKTLSYFYNAKVIYGLPYNRVASSFLDACLEGAVVVCGYRDGECIPLDSDAAEKVYNAVKKYK